MVEPLSVLLSLSSLLLQAVNAKPIIRAAAKLKYFFIVLLLLFNYLMNYVVIVCSVFYRKNPSYATPMFKAGSSL